jgi:DNA-binding transcriptional ArsR family regulator
MKLGARTDLEPVLRYWGAVRMRQRTSYKIPRGKPLRTSRLTSTPDATIVNRMVKHSKGDLDATFSALSDPTRRAILARLALGETTVGELAAPYEMSLPAVSKHLRVLERAGLLARQKSGRVHRCGFITATMKDAAAWIEHYRRFWGAQLDSLESSLSETLSSDAPKRPAAKRKAACRSRRRT